MGASRPRGCPPRRNGFIVRHAPQDKGTSNYEVKIPRWAGFIPGDMLYYRKARNGRIYISKEGS